MHDLTAHEIAALVRCRGATAAQVMRSFLDRSERYEPRLNTYVTLDAEGALQAAEAVDRRIDAGEDPGPLAGVPVSVKDLIAAAGLPLTFGSRLFQDNRAVADAPSVQRVRAAGGCITGKTTTSELGSKAVGDSPLTGVTVNPWHPMHTPGGSSAGAAAGVAAGLVPLALGTDGGGSVRIPASFCGLVGIKGTFGRVPVWPPSATPAFAHVGPLARTVREAMLLFDVIAGPDPRDPASLAWTAQAADSPDPTLSGVRVGFCEDFAWGWADSRARLLAREAAVALGAALNTQPQHWEGLASDPAEAWSIEFYSSIARRLEMDERPRPELAAQLDPLLAQQIARVTQLGLAERKRAQALREQCLHDVALAFQQFDLLVMPTTPVAAPITGVNAPTVYPGSGAVEWSYFTYAFNITGHPAASYPAGLDAQGLPLGVQLVARAGAERLLFRALLALEQVMPPPRLQEPAGS